VLQVLPSSSSGGYKVKDVKWNGDKLKHDFSLKNIIFPANPK
jgi:hypothetical protein